MIQLYRRLLYLFSTSFRAEYGDEMCALFAERSAGASGLARLGLFLGALADLATNAAAPVAVTSRMVVSHSTCDYLFVEEDVPAVVPDVCIDPDWEAFRAGRDPVIEWILRRAR